MRSAWTTATACALAALGACDDSAPKIDSLTPRAVRAGTSGFSLAVAGQGFTRSSVVRFNGSDRPTSYQDRKHLAATIAAEDIAQAGRAQVAVYTPGAGRSRPAELVIESADQAPVARAGPNQTAAVGAEVRLDGSSSTDGDGDLLTYRWTLAERPEGSAAKLSDPTALGPTFLVDRPGSYAVDLVVDDGQLSSEASRVRVSTVNSAPVARAGPDQSAKVGSSIVLDGSGSTDVDGDALSFRWSFASRPPASQASLAGAGEPRASFTLDAPGSYLLELVVEDGRAASAPSRATVSTLNSAPVANAGGPLGAAAGSPVQLDGSASTDVDGDPLTFRWSFLSKPDGSEATLSDSTAVRPTFVPDRPGTYVLQLIVNDGALDAAPHTVEVTTGSPIPTADAGRGQTARVGILVQLDGSASLDPEGRALSYRWSFAKRPAGSMAALSSTAIAKPTFVPDRRGDYVLQLVVNNGMADSSPSTVLVTTENSAPVARPTAAGPFYVGQTAHLDGSSSSDVDGDPLTYRWSFTARPSGSAAALSSSTAAAPTFVMDLPGTYVVQLIVDDGALDSAPQTATLTSTNSAPVARPTAAGPFYVGQTAHLDGSSSSDVDGDPLTYRWSFTARPPGSTAALSSSWAISPSFAPDRPGTYALQLIVNDGVLDSAPATVSLTTSNSAPVAVASPQGRSIHLGRTLALDGTASSDVDGDALGFRWTMTSRPAGSAASLSGGMTARPTFAPDVAGPYEIQLIVSDGKADSTPATATATGVNTAPVAQVAGTSARVGGQASLDGRSSSDSDGDTLTFRWSLLGWPTGSAATLSSPFAQTPTFTVDRPGDYRAQLTVNDGWADSAAATITLRSLNTPPVASAAASPTGVRGSIIRLNAIGSSDVDGDALTYRWTLAVPAGSAATLSSATAVDPTFRLDAMGDFTATLVVNDGLADSAPASLVIAPWECTTCADCAPGLACVDHVCGSCIFDADCCAPLVCAFGTCTSY